MRADDLERIIIDIGLGDRRRKITTNDDTNIMFKCPYHQERNPSAGISANKEFGACYGCGVGFTLLGLIMHMKECSFSQANMYLEEKFNVQKKTLDTKKKGIKRYDDSYGEISESREDGIAILPNYKLAPYRSGKVCHSYLLERGFTKETIRRFKMGWDEVNCRITIPIFNREEHLLGFIARAVLEQKINGKDNPEYIKVYGNKDKYLVSDGFKRSLTLYPLHFFPDGCDTAILVEGSLDAPWFHQLGFSNTLAILNSKISKEQIKLLHSLGVKKIILFLDEDDAGRNGKEKAYKLLRGDFIVYTVEYPSGKNDPQELNREQVQDMLDSMQHYRKVKLMKLE